MKLINKSTGVETNFADETEIEYFFSLGAMRSDYTLETPDEGPIVEIPVDEAKPVRKGKNNE